MLLVEEDGQCHVVVEASERDEECVLASLLRPDTGLLHAGEMIVASCLLVGFLISRGH